MDEDVKQILEAIRQDNAAMRAENAAMRAEMRAENAATRAENATMHADTRRYFDVVAEDLRHKLGLVAEGVATNTERIDRLEATMKEEFADVRAMIKFSHHELDRRVRALEHK